MSIVFFSCGKIVDFLQCLTNVKNNLKRKISMDWIQVLTIVGSNIALILIMFGSTLAMYLHLDKKIDSNRLEASEILKSIRDEIKGFNEKWMEESKDFHRRLCEIEAKKIKDK